MGLRSDFNLEVGLWMDASGMSDAIVEKELRRAVRTGDEETFFRLMAEHKEQLHRSTVFGTWLHFAASQGRLGIVQRLVALGIEPNVRGGVHGGGALHLAASDGHYDIVKFLLERGAELDVSEPERNPLFGAIHWGHTSIAKLLIDRGIDTTVSYTGDRMKNMDAIAFAKEWGRSDIVALLEANQRK